MNHLNWCSSHKLYAIFTLYRIHFKYCSGTVWTRINVLLGCRNCSKAFPVWTEALSVIQFATLHFDLKRSFTSTRFCRNFWSDKSVYPIRNVPLSTAERSSTVPEQYCSGAETASNAAWREALSGTLSATLRFTIRYSVNIALIILSYHNLAAIGVYLSHHLNLNNSGTRRDIKKR